ncbi:ParA family protein [Francisella sp. TX07-6608]|uniref:ParA family protein n=1 Tax=Francisella sp. TX07-6608 TaxID=573568 RepID=UPI0008F9889C|nr:ParA family protein [Francisella sp. TX07-6608]
MRTYTIKNIMDIYRIKKTKAAILKDEEKGLIPEALRIDRGSVKMRAWEESSLPEIGAVYGFLKKPNNTKIISTYSPKGGVLKSSLSFNLARIFALNGLNVLAIGLEVSQKTLTRNLGTDVSINSLAELSNISENGLWEISKGDTTIKKVIKKTNLPTLSYIPESSNLNFLEQKIKDERRREFTLQRIIKPVVNDYDVIILDNSAFWGSQLVQNSLAMATDIICPFGCELESFRSVVENIELINDFKNDMELSWNSFNIIPTLKNNTTLSTQIETFYRSNFSNLVTNTTIHRLNAIAEESGIEKLSVIESHNKSILANDYYDLSIELWKKITNASE